MLVNLCGAPCSGKTTLAKRFIENYPEFTLISIDDIRLEGVDELEAWYVMGQRALACEHCIIESSGVSQRLEPYVLSDLRLQARGIFTIILCGDTSELLKRLQIREETKEKPEVPFVYKSLSLEGLIKKFDNLILGKYPIAWHLPTTINVQERNYKEFERAIVQFKKKVDKALNI